MSGKRKTFGELIHEARKAKGLTLESVGKQTGVGKAYLSMIELGRVKPPFPAVVRDLCRVLGLPYQPTLARSWLEKKPKALRNRALFDAVREEIAG